MKRLTALLLVAVMLLGIGSALADTWTCPSCGRTGNDGNFCPDCGTAKPDEPAGEPAVEPVATEPPAPAAEPEPKAPETNFKVGDYVYFGRYEQDNSEKNGPEDIRWLVIAVEDGKLFLLSEKGLVKHRFNNKSDGSTWGDCELRGWLNGEFLLDAFTASERDAIQLTEVQDTEEEGNPAWDKAYRFSGVTEDKVFLLSYREMNTLVSKKDRLCEPSKLVLSRRVYKEQHDGHTCCWYWLRTSAFKNNAGVVAANGNFETCYIHHEYGVVRPAIWVDATAVK